MTSTNLFLIFAQNMKRRDLAWPLPEAKKQRITSLILVATKKHKQLRICLVELEGRYSYAESIGFVQLKHKRFCDSVVSVAVSELDPETKTTFYTMLKTKYPMLVFSRAMANAFACNDKALLSRMFRDIGEIYGYRTLSGTGWYVESSVLCTRSLGPTDFGELRYQLGQHLNHQRNWTLIFLNLALDCDFPIVEAISHHWPMVMSIVLSENGQHLRLSASKTLNIENGKSYHTMQVLDIKTAWTRKVEAGKQYEMYLSNSVLFNWKEQCQIWVDVFASFGLQIKGTDFGVFE